MRERAVYYVVALAVGVPSVNVLWYALDVHPLLAAPIAAVAGICAGAAALWWIRRGGRRR